MAVTRAYREAMQGLAGMETLYLWYSQVDAEAMLAQFQSAASAKRRKLMGDSRSTGEGQPAGVQQAHDDPSTASRKSSATRHRPIEDLTKGDLEFARGLNHNSQQQHLQAMANTC